MSLNPEDEAQLRLQQLLADGELAIVSAGFRCFTKIELSKQLGIDQESLTFDSGFFPPAAVARMLESDVIDLSKGHTACIKTEDFDSAAHGRGIRFERSSYADIDRLATSPKMPGINQYLDSTFGYYTLSENDGYVLAHYNWHKFGAGKGGRIHNVAKNISAIGDLLTKRLNRLKQKCDRATSVLMVVGETQGYRYMMVDDEAHSLLDNSPIAEAGRHVFGAKCQMVTLSDVATATDALRILRHS